MESQVISVHGHVLWNLCQSYSVAHLLCRVLARPSPMSLACTPGTLSYGLLASLSAVPIRSRRMGLATRSAALAHLVLLLTPVQKFPEFSRVIGLVFIFTVGLADAATPPPTLTPFTVAYSLSTHGLRFATMTRNLSRQGNGDYIFVSQSRATGVAKLVVPGQITEQSRWNLVGDQVYSQTYSYVRTGNKPKTITVRFDWTNGLILGSNGKETWRLDARPGLLDKLSYQLAIMADLQAGKRLLEYTFVDEDEIKIYRFAAVGEEVLETPIGKLRTVKLERTNEKPNRSTILWCASALRYLPVRLDKRKNGATDTAMIKSFSGLP